MRNRRARETLCAYSLPLQFMQFTTFVHDLSFLFTPSHDYLMVYCTMPIFAPLNTLTTPHTPPRPLL